MPQKRRRPKRRQPVLWQQSDACSQPAAAEGIQIDYVAQSLELGEQFAAVADRFAGQSDELLQQEADEQLPAEVQQLLPSEEAPLSKRKIKQAQRMTVAQLKQQAARPEVVEYEDTTAPDPAFLVALKAVRNSVPVPRHWSAKRKYLAGKRGFVKPPFELPAYIRATGIQEARNALRARDEAAPLKAKSRAKARPKTGGLSLDYAALWDAFFRHQTAPPLTAFGELYFEGRECELSLRDKQPGIVGEELAAALALPPLAPPPWLYNQQRFGPPPAYPYLRSPGLTCPIPEGAQWGFHPGGWGRAPVDGQGRPLYGDVFGLAAAEDELAEASGAWLQERRRWGALLPEAEVILAPPPPEEEPAAGRQEEELASLAAEDEQPAVVELPTGRQASPPTSRSSRQPPPPPPPAVTTGRPTAASFMSSSSSVAGSERKEKSSGGSADFKF